MVKKGAIIIDVGITRVPDASHPKGYVITGMLIMSVSKKKQVLSLLFLGCWADDNCNASSKYLFGVLSTRLPMKNALQQGQVVPLMEAFYTIQGEGYHKEVPPILFVLEGVMLVVIGVM